MSAEGDFTKATCPYICPTYDAKQKHKVYLEAGEQRDPLKSGAGPYVPGNVRPFEPQVYPPGAPPKYLPQFADSTSGDILSMSPVGPWASGHLDWTPQAGTTGVRPVVDKYSITRYSTGEWRLSNKKVLTPVAVQRAHNMQENTQKALDNFFSTMESANKNSNRNLDKRIQDLRSWKKKVEKAVRDITEEIEILDEYRSKIKGACRILMLPESISKECLELRTHRYEPDLMRDEAEQELIKEIAMIGEIRRVFTETLLKVEEQMKINKAAKTAIEQDWSDKVVSFNLDKQNLGMDSNSTLLQFHPGVNRWPENATTLEYWQHFCMESIRNCEEVRRKSEELRGDLMTAITNAMCMIAGVAVFPAGWSETSVQETCGPIADQYNLGHCHIRWAYLLAVIGCLDALVLAALAFLLATRHVRLQPDSHYPPGSMYKGEVNNAYVTDATSMSGSRKSLALQPVLIMHPHAPMDMDTYSHYSGRTARSKHGIYANTMHNYQL